MVDLAFVHYLTHIPELDDAHYEILALISKIDSTESDSEICSIIQELMVLKKEHAAEEEQLMAQNEYPYLEHHRASHQKVDLQLDDICVRIQKGIYRKNNKHYCRKLKNIWFEHIDNMDRQYAEFIKKKTGK